MACLKSRKLANVTETSVTGGNRVCGLNQIAKAGCLGLKINGTGVEGFQVLPTQASFPSFSFWIAIYTQKMSEFIFIC